MEIKCNLIKAGEPTLNGRIYPKETLQKAVDSYNKQTYKLGTLGRSMEVSIVQSSHKIKNLYLDNGIMKADIEILDTPNGNILKEMIEKEIPLTLHPHFIGEVDKNNIVEIKKISILNIIKDEDIY